jgi:hypothetical protein
MTAGLVGLCLVAVVVDTPDPTIDDFTERILLSVAVALALPEFLAFAVIRNVQIGKVRLMYRKHEQRGETAESLAVVTVYLLYNAHDLRRRVCRGYRNARCRDCTHLREPVWPGGDHMLRAGAILALSDALGLRRRGVEDL